MRPETVNRIGAAMRRVPGLSPLLDARLERRGRLKRRAAEHRLRDGEAELRRLGGDLRLNVGAGPSPLEGWVNVDLTSEPGSPVLAMDATRPWPLEDETVVAVNSEHFLEHIESEVVPFFFSEAYRVLRPGGVIRTSTPDLRGLARGYLEADPAALEAHRGHGYEARNHADMLNNYVYSWGHRHIYDFETVALLLAQAGFGQIEEAGFGESRHQVLRGIDTHEMGELRGIVVAVDAVRPS